MLVESSCIDLFQKGVLYHHEFDRFNFFFHLDPSFQVISLQLLQSLFLINLWVRVLFPTTISEFINDFLAGFLTAYIFT